MALGVAILNGAADGAAAQVAFGAIHSADSAGSQTSNERRAVTWDPATGAVAAMDGMPLSYTGAAGASAAFFGIWSAGSGGTYRGGVPITGDATFNAAGQYQITAGSMTATDET